MEVSSPVPEDLWIEAYREPRGGGGYDTSLPEHFNSSLVFYQENQIEVYDAGRVDLDDVDETCQLMMLMMMNFVN